MTPKISENKVNYEAESDFNKIFELDMVSDEVV